eukprot:scaffold243_cov175-Amphora_coffeaeformis.AAC.4
MPVFVPGRIQPWFKIGHGHALVHETGPTGGPRQQCRIGTTVHDWAEGERSFGTIARGFVLNVVHDVSIAGQSSRSRLKLVTNGLTRPGGSAPSRRHIAEQKYRSRWIG